MPNIPCPLSTSTRTYTNDKTRPVDHDNMMIGERNRSISALHIPPWNPSDDSMSSVTSPFYVTSFSGNSNGNAGAGGAVSPKHVDSSVSLHHYLLTELDLLNVEGPDVGMDDASSDHFRMFEFKIRRCPRGRSHDWMECPFAHPGEKARRRDPRKYHYSGVACPEFRKGYCFKGESCEYAHGVFESWLHPGRYRTQPCKDGISCRRRVCFFAHTSDQLRVLSTHDSADFSEGSPIHHASEIYLAKDSSVSSPTSILISPPIYPSSDSPLMSPRIPQSCHGSFNSVHELVASMRNLHLGKIGTDSGRGLNAGSGFCSTGNVFNVGSGFRHLPSTPTRTPTKSSLSPIDTWDQIIQEEPAMERVESGRDLRDKIYARLSKENSLKRGAMEFSSPDVDLGWVSELIK